jgi:multidrug efflux pump subunit AcrA (membrane-fusion protein)
MHFSGSVASIYPQSSTTNRSLPIRVVLDNRDGQLKPNMFAHGVVTTLTHRNVVLIPFRALVTQDGRTQVFVHKDGKAKRKKVTLGICSPDGSLVQVNGVQPEDQVIVTGLKSLEEGQLVTTSIGAGANTKVASNGKEGA